MSNTKFKTGPNAFTTIKHVRDLEIPDAPAKAVLLYLATFADGPTGEGACCGQPRIVRETGYCESTVRNKLHWLRDNGYIREGDQSRAAHFRADQRPIVYDVVLATQPPRHDGV